MKQILMTLIEPYRTLERTDAISVSRIPDTIAGWRFDDKNPDIPVCNWTGVLCNDDEAIIGLDLEDRIWIDSLLGNAQSSPEGVANEEPQHSRSLEKQGYHKKQRFLQEQIDDSNNRPMQSSAAPFLPPLLGKLTSLRMIKLSSNQIRGSIPKSIAKLPNLEIFEVRSNYITGTFPHFYSEQLKVFDISKNRFHGTLPDDLFAHPKIGPRTAPFLQPLIKFDISHNELNGTIPLNGRSGTFDHDKKKETSLQKLKFFDIGFNFFSGTIPNNLGNLESLSELFLEHNRLIGTIPKSLYRGSGVGSNPLPLTQLYLQQNDLSGSLPSGLAQIPQLKELFVDGNKLTGTIPSVLCVEELNNVFLNDEKAAKGCDGVSCPVNSASAEGVAPCTACPEDNGFNKYLGHHSPECQPAMGEIEILDLFFIRVHGEEWHDSSYYWERGSDVCQRKGIECNQEGSVVNITLTSLGLRGVLPTELGALSSLQVFNVSNNDLTGFLPSDFRFAPLTHFDIRGNRLSGHVPILMCIKDGVNNNGIGPPGVDFELLYSCDNIVCSHGSYSSIGRSSLEDNIACLPCYDDPSTFFIGRDECSDIRIFGHQIRRDDAIDAVRKTAPLVVLVGVMVFYVLKAMKRKVVSFDSGHLSLPSSTRNIAVHRYSSSSLDEFEDDDANDYYSDDDWTAAASEGETGRLSRKKSEMVVLRSVS